MIEATVLRMYSETEENRFLEVTYANGTRRSCTSRTSTPAR
jgi:proteasome-associated ATPase